MVGVISVAELERRGHRQRMRQAFIDGGMENAPDHNLLELYLSLVIPQKDVKQLSYDLINKFGSLEAVFNAPVEQLMEVNGIKEVSAVAISLVPQISKRIAKNKNTSGIKLDSLKKTFTYCRNLLEFEKNEAVYIITLNSDMSIINYYKISDGTVNSAVVDFRLIANFVLRDNPSAVMLTHNHPNGLPCPSDEDDQFTANLKVFLRNMSVSLYDHIIVGKNECFNYKSDLSKSRFIE